MAEDIIQRLGFDAGGAIQQINTLSTALDSLNKSLGGVGGGVKTWNAEGKKVSKLFQSINTAATSALGAIDKLKSAQAGLATTGAAVVKPDTAGVQAQLAMVQQLAGVWGKLPAQATAASKQAYQKAAAALASFAATNKVTASQMAAAFAGNMQKSGAAANGLVTRIKALKTAHTAAAKSFQTQTQMMTVTWQTLMRVMTTRLVLGAISRLTMALREGTDAAIEFGIRIQEIGTIAGKGVNLDVIRGQMLALSSETGKGLADVAEGYYQALSNQVGDATQTLYVYEQAAKLSIATNSSLGDSVNLLTAAINGWGLGAESAADTAGKLFKSIELGRFRVADLANIIGRIGPMTREMGIGLEETMSALTTMTTQGTRANTAITQMRAIMSQMLKPTEKLTKLMQSKWGVDNAQQAVIKFGGFVGVLKALKAEAGDNAAEMAGLFSNVRALTGILATTTAIEKATKDLKELEEAGAGVLKWAVGKVLASEAKEAEKSFNDLKIAVQELGNALLPVTIALTKMVTGLVNKLGDLTQAFAVGISGAILVQAVANFKNLTLAINGATVATSRFGIALKTALPHLLAFAAGYALGEWIKSLGYDAEEAAEKVTKSIKAMGAATTEANVGLLRHQQKTLGKQLSVVVDYYSELNKLHNDDVESAKATNKASVAFAKDQLGGLLTTQKQIVKSLEDTRAKAAQIIKKAEANSLKTRQSLNQKFFDWNLDGTNNLTKAWAKANRAQELISKGVALLRKPGISPEGIQWAQELIALGKTQAEQASQSASSLTNAQQKRSMLFRTRQAEVTAAEALLKVDQATRDLAKRQAAEAKAALKAEQDALKNMQEYITAITKGMNQFNMQGEQKTAAEMEKDTKGAAEAFKNLNAMMEDPKKLRLMSISDMLGFADLKNQFQKQMAKVPRLEAKLFADYNETKAQIEAASVKVPVHVKTILEAHGFEIRAGTALSDVNQSLGVMNKRLESAQAEYTQVQAEIDKTAAATRTMGWALKPWEADLSKVNKNFAPIITKYNELVTLAKGLAGKEILPGTAEYDQFKKLTQTFDEFQQLYTQYSGVDPGTGFLQSEAITTVKTGIADIVAGVTKIGALDFGQKLRQNLNILKNDLGTVIKLTELAEQGLIIPGAIQGQLIDPTSVTTAKGYMDTMGKTAGGIKTSFKDVKTNAELAAAALNSIKIPTIQTQAQGGYMKASRFAAGGFAPQGTDTIPAMLSPGEFVVNARATRRFFSQLVAINAGVQPIYRQEGGPVTNVGDINVSVDGGSSTKQTARGIATALRRELRRKTSTLN